MDTRPETGNEGTLSKAGEATRETGEQIRRAAADLAEKGKEAGQKLTAALETARAKVEERAMEGARVTDRAIREHPYESVGLAFGIGVLIGVLINRR